MQLIHGAGRLALLAIPSSPTLCTPTAEWQTAAGGLVVSETWTRATPPGAQAGSGYLPTANKGRESDQLTGGSLAAAKEVQVRQMSMANGVMTMERLEGAKGPERTVATSGMTMN